MQITKADLRERYKTLSTEELIDLRNKGTLTEHAISALEEELDRRNISLEEREHITNELKSEIRMEAKTSEDLASLGDRLIAQIIDTIIAIALLLTGTVSPLIGVLLFFAYLWLADALPRGQSIGKRVMKIAVVDAKTRKPCSIIQSLIRNFLLSFLGIIDWLFIFGNKKRRLGDMAAHTIVTKC